VARRLRRWRWTKFGKIDELREDDAHRLHVEVVPSLGCVVVQAARTRLCVWDLSRGAVRGWVDFSGAGLDNDDGDGSFRHVRAAGGDVLVLFAPRGLPLFVDLGALEDGATWTDVDSARYLASFGEVGDGRVVALERFCDVVALAVYPPENPRVLATYGRAVAGPISVHAWDRDDRLGALSATRAGSLEKPSLLCAPAAKSACKLAFAREDCLVIAHSDRRARVWTRVGVGWALAATLRGYEASPWHVAASRDLAALACFHDRHRTRDIGREEDAEDADDLIAHDQVGLWDLASAPSPGALVCRLAVPGHGVRAIVIAEARGVLVTEHDEAGGIHLWRLLARGETPRAVHVAAYALHRPASCPINTAFLARDDHVYVGGVGVLLAFSTGESAPPSSDDAPEATVVNCFACGTYDAANSQVCQRCKAVHFCGPACLRAGWKRHKPHCVPADAKPGRGAKRRG
jgi:hypothetical protein